MKQISLLLPKGYITALDSLVSDGFYPTRAEAMRLAIRDRLINDQPSLWLREVTRTTTVIKIRDVAR